MRKRIWEKYCIYGLMQLVYSIWALCLLFTKFWLIGILLFALTYSISLCKKYKVGYLTTYVSVTTKVSDYEYNIYPDMVHISILGWVLNCTLSAMLLGYIILQHLQ